MTDELKIDKDIPLPGRGKGKTGVFRAMEIGDSVFLPNANVANTMSSTKHAAPARFSGRSVIENEVKGTRIWRIA